MLKLAFNWKGRFKYLSLNWGSSPSVVKLVMENMRYDAKDAKSGDANSVGARGCGGG